MRLILSKIRRPALIALGCACLALSFNLFFGPFRISPGGVSGVAMVLRALIGVPVGAASAMLNLPLLFLAGKRLGKGFVVWTAYATLFSSFLIDVSAPLLPVLIPPQETMLACLCGGVLIGTGVGLIVRNGATTGGSEIVSKLLQKKRPHLKMGTVMLLVDGAIVCLSAAVFGDFSLAVYALISIYICGRVMDLLLYGLDFATLTYIISDYPEQIAAGVMDEMQRGVTFLYAQGGYTGDSKRVLLIAIGRREIAQLRALIKRYDPAAFLIVTEGHQIYGDGFLKD